MRRHADPVPHGHRAVVCDQPVTTLVATVVDCARSLPVLDRLVVTDAALRTGADTDQIAIRLDLIRGRPGPQTPEECWPLPAPVPSRPRRQRPGISDPVPPGVRRLACPADQVPVRTWQGPYWVDLGYPDLRIAIEYDGRSKYVGDAWFKEKRRLDAIIEAGWRVIRVTAEDLTNPFRLVVRIRHLLAITRP